MVFKWATRLAKAGIALGGCSLAVIFLDSARGTVDTNERIKDIVAAASAAQPSKPLELTRYEITSVKSGSMVEKLRVSGDLQPVTTVVLRAKVGGKILDLNVREGQTIKAGDVLARFETDDLQSTLLQRESDRSAAEAELQLAEQTRKRIVQLSAKNISSREQLDKANSDVTASRARVSSLSAQVDIARVALRDAEVLAPFDGIVSNRVVAAGSRVSANAELLTVVDISTLEAKVLVSTRDIPRVAVGQIAELKIDGMEGQAIKGTVARINPVAASGTRFIPVYLQLSNQNGRLWGGMFATGSILVREKENALVVPAISLRRDGAGDYLLKLRNGRLLRQPVMIGPFWSGGSLIEIAGGLKDGDTIVTSPLPELRPDVAVILTKAG